MACGMIPNTMRRTRGFNSDNGEDSLELLLDTICNVFGGVIFIAMLVALLVNTPGVVQNVAETAADLSLPSQAMQLRQEAQSLHAAVLDAKSAVELLASDEAVHTLERAAELRRELAAAQARAEQLRSWLDRVRQLDPQRLERAAQALHDAEQAVAAAETLQAQTPQQKFFKGRLPQERSTQKRQVSLLVQGGRIYWIDYGTSKTANLPGRDDDVIIELLGQVLEVRPKAGRGFPIDDVVAATNILNHLDPRNDVFTLFVASDSVAAFRYYRDQLTQRGYQYGLSTFDAADALRLGLTDHVTVQ